MNTAKPKPARPNKTSHKYMRISMAVASAALITGCATVQNPTAGDPWESYNRTMYSFNDAVDRAFLKPIAVGYETITPKPVRTCIHNIFGNLEDVWSAVNSLLQGRGRDFVDTFGRILLNSTVGLGGCIDVASMNGARKIPNDLGTTFGVWGFGPGPYFVIPFYGPSTVRDSLGTATNLASPIGPTAAVFAIDNIPVRNSVLGLYVVDYRASLLEPERLVDDIAIDKYSFIRDAYLQRRKAMINSRQSGEHAVTEDRLNDVHNVSSDSALPVYEDPDLPVYDDPEN